MPGLAPLRIGDEGHVFRCRQIHEGSSSWQMKGERIRYRQTGEFYRLVFSEDRRRPYLSTVAAMELSESWSRSLGTG
jgi:hypothetical protein